MLAVETLAYPQPRIAICSVADGPLFATAGPAPLPITAAGLGIAPRAGAAGAPGGGAAPATKQGVVGGTPSGSVPPPLNMRTTGTGPVAFFGVLSVAMIVTFNSGYAELSTRPTSCFVTIGTSPVLPSVVRATLQLTFGIFLGRRP